MLLSQLRSTFIKTLKPLYSEEEAQTVFNLLLAHYGSYTKQDIAMKLWDHVPERILSEIHHACNRLLAHEPVQYIIGHVAFSDLIINVSEATLIPRPETEELVSIILEELKREYANSEIHVLDIGTGSGCIAIALAKLNFTKVTAWDISSKALQVAQKNAIQNKVSVNFEEVDILNIQAPKKAFNLIVSNPPYVLDAEKAVMQNRVLDFEPSQALFVPNNEPLLYYKAIINWAIKGALSKNGVLWFEINETQGKPLVKHLKQMRFRKVQLLKDFLGKPRFIKASY